MNDKLKHFTATAAIVFLTLTLFAVIPHGEMYGWDKAIAVLIGTAAAAGKEIIYDDWWGLGTPDFYDFVAGMWGAFAAMFVWVIVETVIYIF